MGLVPLYSAVLLIRATFSESFHGRLIFQAFNNEAFETRQYDATLKTYEKASVKIATSLALLNSGQNFIFSSALTCMMLLAAQGVVKGESSSTLVFPSGLMQTRYNDRRRSGYGEPTGLSAVFTAQLSGYGISRTSAESDRYGGHVQLAVRRCGYQGMPMIALTT